MKRSSFDFSQKSGFKQDELSSVSSVWRDEVEFESGDENDNEDEDEAVGPDGVRWPAESNMQVEWDLVMTQRFSYETCSRRGQHGCRRMHQRGFLA